MVQEESTEAKIFHHSEIKPDPSRVLPLDKPGFLAFYYFITKIFLKTG
jgi:hypothetical protein